MVTGQDAARELLELERARDRRRRSALRLAGVAVGGVLLLLVVGWLGVI